MTENLLFAPSAEMKARTFISARTYDRMYARSVADPEAFWKVEADRIDWIKAPTEDQEHQFRLPQCLDQMVRGWGAQHRRQLHPPLAATTGSPISSSTTASAASPMC